MIGPDALLHKLPHRLQVLCVLVGGMLIHMTIGGIDASFGNIIPYAASYLKREYGHDHIEYNVMVWIGAFFDAGIAASFFGGLLDKKFGQRFTILVAATIVMCGSVGSYFAIRKSFWLWAVCYGLVNGIGMGIAYNTVLVCAMRWMPNRRGFATGIIQVGYAIGSSIFVVIQTGYVNPNNYKVRNEGFFANDALLDRVPTLFLVLGATFFVMDIVGCFLLMTPKTSGVVSFLFLTEDDMRMLKVRLLTSLAPDATELIEIISAPSNKTPPGMSSCAVITTFFSRNRLSVSSSTSRRSLMTSVGLSSKEERASATTPLLSPDKGDKKATDYNTEPKATDDKSENLSPRQVLHSSTFWSLWFTWICIIQPGNFIQSYYKVFGATFIPNDFLLSALASGGAVASVSSRIIWGYLGDRYSYQSAMVFVTGLMTVVSSTICVTRFGGPAVYFIWVLSALFALGGPYSLCPMAITNAFGEKNAEVNNGLYISSMGASTILSAAMTTALLGVLTYCEMFVMFAGFGFLALCLTLPIHFTKYGSRIGKRKKRQGILT